jgi:hypothetical protein
MRLAARMRRDKATRLITSDKHQAFSAGGVAGLRTRRGAGLA